MKKKKKDFPESSSQIDKGIRLDRLPGGDCTATPPGTGTRTVAGSSYHHKETEVGQR